MYVSRNDVIDAIMHYELNHRCNKNVAISVHGTLPEITSVSSIDICTLFSNLLSNAISAVNKCSDTPWLEITFSAGQKFFLIEISNDVDEIIKYLEAVNTELSQAKSIMIKRKGIEHNLPIHDICYISAQVGGTELWTKKDMFQFIFITE